MIFSKLTAKDPLTAYPKAIQYSRNPKIIRLISKFPSPPNKDVGEGLNTAFRAMQEMQYTYSLYNFFNSSNRFIYERIDITFN